MIKCWVSTDVCVVCSDLQMHDRVRGHDIRLLQFFNVSYIFDLMLELKKVKFGMKYVYFSVRHWHGLAAT